jgi:hypothetical protein
VSVPRAGLSDLIGSRVGITLGVVRRRLAVGAELDGVIACRLPIGLDASGEIDHERELEQGEDDEYEQPPFERAQVGESHRRFLR